jgi:hypothetical protein
MKFQFIFFLLIITTFGCNKLKDNEKPVITITSPKTNDTITGNTSEINLQFTATDNSALSSLSLEINDLTGNNYYTDSKALYGKNYSYKNSFEVVKNTKLKALVMKVIILDEAKNESISTTTFYLAP